VKAVLTLNSYPRTHALAPNRTYTHTQTLLQSLSVFLFPKFLLLPLFRWIDKILFRCSSCIKNRTETAPSCHGWMSNQMLVMLFKSIFCSFLSVWMNQELPISGGFRGAPHPLRNIYPAKPNEKTRLHYLGWPQKVIFT